MSETEQSGPAPCYAARGKVRGHVGGVVTTCPTFAEQMHCIAQKGAESALQGSAEMPEWKRVDAKYCKEGCRKMAARSRRITSLAIVRIITYF
ncbi:hypothetical protein [Ruegeria arenilitoris]|uniref:hypothetical protein n=1 Tax=Ruegeria arenilitoris TaxID=1173585 RepID=UPI00147F7E47|nr:hypothetical protein [Ruegeria arenilitoris]